MKDPLPVALPVPNTTPAGDDNALVEGTSTPIVDDFQDEESPLLLQSDEALALPRNRDIQVHVHSKSIASRAEQEGLARARQEKEEIRRGKAKAYANNFHSKEAIEKANQVSRRRDAEGLQVHDDARVQQEMMNLEKARQEAQQAPSETQEKETPGYEVQEYSIRTSYTTSNYEVSEYKSVYDR